MEANTYLEQIPMWTRKKNSLPDVRAFLDRMGNPDRHMKIIHVAGTNGKGSVCAFLTSIFQEAGYRTGTFTSPHLTDIRERFLYCNQMIGQEIFEESFQKVKKISDEMVGEGYCHPTFFEFLFYMALTAFDMLSTDVVILETGLGGRLDTTNVIEHPLAEVITSISLDHTQYLGNTVEEIAGEKAGILKAGSAVIADGSDERAVQVIKRRAGELSLPVTVVSEKDIKTASLKNGRLLVTAEPDYRLEVPFPAMYQAVNAMLAVRCMESLREVFPWEREMLERGIRAARWQGRMEQVLPGVYFDGAHNPGGIRAFAQTARMLMEQEKASGCYLLFSAVSDKRYEEMIHYLAEHLPLKGVIAAHIDSERGMEEEELKELFEKDGVPALSFHRAKEALDYGLSRKTEDDILFCVGSLYLIGELKAAVRRKKDDSN